MSPYTRPEPDEYAPFYATYVEKVPNGDVLEHLEAQLHDTLALVRDLDDDAARQRYAEGKWSVLQVLGHMADTERIFTVRALHFARGHDTPLPGFDQDLFVAHGDFDQRPASSFVDELRIVRQATLTLFRNLPEAAATRRGIASDAPMTVRAAAWVITGHELHHQGVLREKYGLGGPDGLGEPVSTPYGSS